MQAKTGKEVIIAMLWLYEHRLEHTQNVFFKDKNGHRIPFDRVVDCHGLLSQEASKIHSACLGGCHSLIDTAHNAKGEADFLMEKEAKSLYGKSYVDWNDSLIVDTKSQVIKFLRDILKQA